MEVLVKDIIEQGQQCLKQCGVADWKTDSMLLAEYCLGVTKKELLLKPDITVNSGQKESYMEAVRRRCSHIPLQHITGIQEFMGLEFEVNENVLIPRQDTELLVELVLAFLKKSSKENRVLDLCTGSGCIAVAIDKLCENAKVTAGDISEKALETAVRNNRKHGASVAFVHSDLFERITGTYDVIVSNPPYIKTDEIKGLMPEVKNHDPILALDGDADGLEFYRKISERAPDYLKPEGALFYEIGFDQGKAVREILAQNGFSKIEIHKDLAGNDRIVFAKLERK